MSVSITPNPNVQGPQGLTGAQGTQGVQGTEGLQGVQGLTGAQGETGAQGTQGVTGTQGLTGIQGTDGVNGVQGLTGTQGIQGLQGLTASTPVIVFDAETTAYTLQAANVNQWVTMSSGSSQAITVPSGVFTTGQIIYVQRLGSGAVPITASGVTITSTGATSSAPNLRAQFSSASIICTGTNTFTVVGDIS
jgi:hypothetical protein